MTWLDLRAEVEAEFRELECHQSPEALDRWRAWRRERDREACRRWRAKARLDPETRARLCEQSSARRHRAAQARRAAEVEGRVCPRCGQPVPLPAKGPVPKWCSRKCGHADAQARYRERMRPVAQARGLQLGG
jgi:endogenous inhibitor of DNA gyrase (YacG/DUF329 family)